MERKKTRHKTIKCWAGVWSVCGVWFKANGLSNVHKNVWPATCASMKGRGFNLQIGQGALQESSQRSPVDKPSQFPLNRLPRTGTSVQGFGWQLGNVPDRKLQENEQTWGIQKHFKISDNFKKSLPWLFQVTRKSAVASELSAKGVREVPNGASHSTSFTGALLTAIVSIPRHRYNLTVLEPGMSCSIVWVYSWKVMKVSLSKVQVGKLQILTQLWLTWRTCSWHNFLHWADCRVRGRRRADAQRQEGTYHFYHTLWPCGVPRNIDGINNGAKLGPLKLKLQTFVPWPVHSLKHRKSLRCREVNPGFRRCFSRAQN